MKLPNLTREQFTDLKELLTERIVDNMTTEQLAEYVADDYSNTLTLSHTHEFL